MNNLQLEEQDALIIVQEEIIKKLKSDLKILTIKHTYLQELVIKKKGSRFDNVVT